MYHPQLTGWGDFHFLKWLASKVVCLWLLPRPAVLKPKLAAKIRRRPEIFAEPIQFLKF